MATLYQELFYAVRDYFELKRYIDGPLGGAKEWEEFQRQEERLRALVSTEHTESDIPAVLSTAAAITPTPSQAADALETLALIATHRLAVEALTDEHEALYFECAGPHGVYKGDTIEEAVRKAVAGYRKEPTE